jgi:uronate dehydrogenase
MRISGQTFMDTRIFAILLRYEGAEAMKKVLMTGASGKIGVSLRELLKDRYALRLQERPGGKPVGPARAGEEIAHTDLTDMDGMRAAVHGCDAVIHLAASSAVQTPWEAALTNNIVGQYTVLEAMRHEGVPRMVFATTNHVTGYYELKGRPCYPDMPVRPDGYYGASKAFGEALARLYVDEHGLEVICLRIGSWLPQPENVRNLSTWLSPRDMAQLAWRAIETPLTWGIFYAISGNTRRYWDIGPTQEQLGYTPEDDAEHYAAQIEGTGFHRAGS